MSWKRFFRRAEWDRERREEIESYLRIEADDRIARGVSPADADAAARRKLGNPSLIREDIYRMNTIPVIDTVAADLRYAFRALRRNPGFTAAALLTLVIGIGANTAVFSVVNSILLKPLAYPDADRVVAMRQQAPGAEGLASVSGGLLLSASMYYTYSERNRTLQSMGVWNSGTFNVTGLAEPEQVRAVFITDGVLQAFGVAPAVGRWLSAGDQKPGGAPPVMLSYGYWQRRFGGDRSIAGRTITLNSRPREIAGVMPRSFRHVNVDFDILAPIAFDRAKVMLPGFGFQGVARLKPGVTIAQANADLARLVPVWMKSWPMFTGVDPKVYENWRIAPDLRPLKDDITGNLGGVLWVLMGTIGIVMLIACANVANLLLVRTESRQQELAVRAALGAGPARIVRSILVESLLLALLGGALGLGLAQAGVRLLVAIGPATLPRLDEVAIDAQALVFTLAVSLLSALFFGLIPALKYAGPRTSLALRGGGRTHSGSRERRRGRDILVVAQVALALVLLIGSGLMIRTFIALRAVDPGFTNPEQIQTVRTTVPGQLIGDPEQVARVQQAIVDNLSAIPGVASAAFATEVPLETTTHDFDVVCPEGQVVDASQVPPLRLFVKTSPGFFQTMGARFAAGRDFTWTDLYGRRPVAILSATLARELFPGNPNPAAAIGKRISTCLPGAPPREVVGVVHDIRQNGVHEPAPAIAYWPTLGESLYNAGQTNVSRSVTFAIRGSRAGTDDFSRRVGEAVWSANLPLASMETMGALYDRSLARTSFTLVMLAIAGAMALVLGVVGIYGVISYVVTQRRREIGIRIALGAPQAGIRRMFVRYSLALAGVGVVIGLVAAVGLTRLLTSLLFGVRPIDPLTYAAVPVLLIAVAALAAYLPARRAAAVSPVEALKGD